MRVTMVSETIQLFRGLRYYLCGRYFQRRGVRLHRAVWEAHFGPIPSGFHVHHVNGDRSQNQIENLALMEGRNHVGHHSSKPTEAQSAARRSNQSATAEWHRSEEGRAWHASLSRATWRKRDARTVACAHCGREYSTRAVGLSLYCHRNCRMAALRKRRRSTTPHRDS